MRRSCPDETASVRHAGLGAVRVQHDEIHLPATAPGLVPADEQLRPVARPRDRIAVRAGQPDPPLRARRIHRPDPVVTAVGDPSAGLAEAALEGRGRLGAGSRRARVHLRGGLRRTCFRRGSASGHQHRHRHRDRDPRGVRAPRTHPRHRAVLKTMHRDSCGSSARLVRLLWLHCLDPLHWRCSFW